MAPMPTPPNEPSRRSHRRDGGAQPAPKRQHNARKSRNPRGDAPRRGAGHRPPRRPSPDVVARRRAHLPALTYPPQLPVSQRRDEIIAAIRDHQVVVVSGATGSGKTTQLPKMCLELGLGAEALIGHTQPRRLAARTVAERIASELGQRLGDTIGYQVRFTDEVGPNTMVKLMTDGILLAEIASDPMLRRYDAIIVDEAHERSLNIDFILGYLAALLPKRPDLKVIITSATIDSERFAAHFSHALGGADVPIIEVSGRTYPVEIVYRPLTDPEGRDIDVEDGICEAVDDLSALGEGDILVFLPGEQDIRDVDAALRDHLRDRYLAAGDGNRAGRKPRSVEVVPLYARLSPAEQHRVFEPHQTRRVVLATNVAETSLTVPGIHYVIDPGLARISRFSNRTKVQRLPIEPISQASANQRSGRCGRIAEGVAIRLYSEEEFEARPEFTEPEILRTSLAAVILQMASLGLTPIEGFPFLDPPDPRQVRDGINLLVELGALKDPKSLKLTRIGRDLARLPIDPRLARILVEANRRGCASDVLVIVAALSMQDVRLRPADSPGTADAAHARFTDPTSDFLAYLNLWRYIRTQSRELSGSALRRLCQREYLHYLRCREWQDMVGQLRSMAGEIGIRVHQLSRPTPADIDAERGAGLTPADAVAAACVAETTSASDSDAIHRSLLVGLLSNLGRWDAAAKEYEGTRGTRFHIWPGSGLAKRHHDWVMTAELVETSRLFARSVARIDPAWIDEAAGPLLKRSYSGIFWSSRNGAAMIRERASLYGLTISADKPVLLGRLGNKRLPGERLHQPTHAIALSEALDEAKRADAEPAALELAREMFIRHALVEGDWRGRPDFAARNAKALEAAREVERRTRKPGLVAGEDALFRFFDERVGADVCSEGHFSRWWKAKRREDPHFLDFPPSLLLPDLAEQVAPAGPTNYTSGSAAAPTLGERVGDQVSPADLVASAKQREALGFPDRWRGEGAAFALAYEFDPGSDFDGVSVRIPVEALGGLDPEPFEWLVPGMWDDLVAGLIRALPKQVRRQLVPAPDVAAEVTAWIRQRLDNPEGEAEPTGPSAADKKQQALEASMARLANWAGVEAPAPRTKRQAAPGSGADSAAAASRAARWDRRNTAPPAALRELFTRAVDATRSVEVTEGAWEQARRALPAHLRMTFIAVDPTGRDVGHGKDLRKLAHSMRGRERAAVRDAIRDARAATHTTGRRGGRKPQLAEQRGLAAFPTQPNPIPESVRIPGPAGTSLDAFPALLAPGAPADPSRPSWGDFTGWEGPWRADLVTLDRAVVARARHADGLAALILAAHALPTARVTTRWRGAEAAALAASPYASTEVLVADAQWVAARGLVDEWAGQGANMGAEDVRDPGRFAELSAWVRDRLEDRVYDVVRHATDALVAVGEFERAVAAADSMRLLDILSDERDHLSRLMGPGFIAQWGDVGLPHLARWIRAAAARIARAADNPGRDKGVAWQAREARATVQAALARATAEPWTPERAHAAWEVVLAEEELRVSLFAQQLGTARKISPKRLDALAKRL